MTATRMNTAVIAESAMFCAKNILAVTDCENVNDLGVPTEITFHCAVCFCDTQLPPSCDIFLFCIHSWQYYSMLYDIQLEIVTEHRNKIDKKKQAIPQIN